MCSTPVCNVFIIIIAIIIIIIVAYTEIYVRDCVLADVHCKRAICGAPDRENYSLSLRDRAVLSLFASVTFRPNPPWH